MDFIERLFHVAPDGGTGLLELTITLALLFIPIGLVAIRRRAKRQARVRHV